MAVLKDLFGSGTFPDYNFDFTHTSGEGTYWTRTRVAGGAPSGKDSVRIDGIGTNSPGVQSSPGWQWTVPSPSTVVNYGEARYIRSRLKIISPVRWEGNDNQPVRFKWMNIGNLCQDAGGGHTRFISNVIPTGSSPWNNISNFRLDFALSVDQGREFGGLSVDTWHSIQWKLQTSSAQGVGDGEMYMYLDSDNASEATPTATWDVANIVPTPGDTTSIVDPRGWYDSGPLCSGGPLNLFCEVLQRVPAVNAELHFEVADLEYADTFDPNWYITGTSVRRSIGAYVRR